MIHTDGRPTVANAPRHERSYERSLPTAISGFYESWEPECTCLTSFIDGKILVEDPECPHHN